VVTVDWYKFTDVLEDCAAVRDRYTSLKFSNPAREIHSFNCFVHVLFLNISGYFVLDPQITKYREGSFGLSPTLTAD
jgi:hypothetical protein